MKKMFGLTIISFMIFLIILIGPSCTKEEEKNFKIGVVFPLTGEAAKYGKNSKNGVGLAIEEINEKGGIKGKKVYPIYEDSKALPKEGVDAVSKLINIDKVSVIIGPMASSVMLASAPVIEKAKVVSISHAASNPKITNAGDYIFRTDISDSYEGQEMARVCYKKLGIRKVSVIFVNNEYGSGIKSEFVVKFKELGGIVPNKEGFNQGATEFKTIATKVGNDESEGLYIIGYNEMINIIKQLRELDTKKRLLSTAVLEDPELIKVLGNAAEGIIILSRDYISERPVVQSFLKKYSKKFNKMPDFYFAAQAYDAVKMIALAIENSDFNPENIKNELYKIKDFDGVSGVMTFDKNGDVNKELTIKIVRNNNFVRFE